MPIQQSKQQSDLEKRLQILRRQVYGSNSGQFRITQNDSDNQKSGLSESLINRYSGIPSSSESFRNESFRTDTTYLQQDLLKILTLSSLAIAGQVVLFFLLKNHILNLNFF